MDFDKVLPHLMTLWVGSKLRRKCVKGIWRTLDLVVLSPLDLKNVPPGLLHHPLAVTSFWLLYNNKRELMFAPSHFFSFWTTHRYCVQQKLIHFTHSEAWPLALVSILESMLLCNFNFKFMIIRNSNILRKSLPCKCSFYSLGDVAAGCLWCH